MERILFLTALILLQFLPSGFAAPILQFDAKAQVKKAAAERFELVQPGTEIEVSTGESLLVVTENQLPILVFSPASNDSKIRLDENFTSTALKKALEPELNKALNEILDETNSIQISIQKRNYTSALNQVGRLKQKYPDVSSILFLSGTVQFLNNNKASAIEDLEKGLLVDPQNETAKKLLQQLRAGR